MQDDARARRRVATYLLHDAGLALGEGDVAARLVLDELDLNLPALAAGLVIVVVVVVGSRARALGAAVGVAEAERAIAVVVDRGRRVLVVVGDFRGHGGEAMKIGYSCLADEALSWMRREGCGEVPGVLASVGDDWQL